MNNSFFFFLFEMVTKTYIKKNNGNKPKELKRKVNQQVHKTTTTTNTNIKGCTEEFTPTKPTPVARSLTKFNGPHLTWHFPNDLFVWEDCPRSGFSFLLEEKYSYILSIEKNQPIFFLFCKKNMLHQMLKSKIFTKTRNNFTLYCKIISSN